MTKPDLPSVVHVVSHGPHCLDGVAAAAAIARFYDGAEIRPRFSPNPKIDEILQSVRPEGEPGDEELWITDISWTQPETDAHLRELAGKGLRIFWIDHHRTAIERLETGRIDVPFTDQVVTDEVSAARLVFDYLRERLRREGRSLPRFEAFEEIALLADDNDRWLHEMDGSWDLALTVRAMNGPEAFEDFVRMEGGLEYTPRMQAAHDRVEGELRVSRELADRTRRERTLASGVNVVSALVQGYPSEIGDRWGRESSNTVFVFFDLSSAAVSYRRSPDCEVDLSQVAKAFGGGGHPAAAGCEMNDLLDALSEGALEQVARVVESSSG